MQQRDSTKEFRSAARVYARQIYTGGSYENFKKGKQTLLSARKCQPGQKSWGRYSFLGYEPTMEITCTDGDNENPADGKWQIRERSQSRLMHPGDTITRDPDKNIKVR